MRRAAAQRTPMAKAEMIGVVEKAVRRTEMVFDGPPEQFRQYLILALGMFQSVDEKGRCLAVLPQPVPNQSEDVVLQIGRGLLMHLQSLGLAEASGQGSRGDVRYSMDADVLDMLWPRVDDKSETPAVSKGNGWSVPKPKPLPTEATS